MDKEIRKAQIEARIRTIESRGKTITGQGVLRKLERQLRNLK